MRLKETAAGGSTGAGAIAANPHAVGGMHRREIKSSERDWRDNILTNKEQDRKLSLSPEAKEKLRLAKEKLKKKKTLRGFIQDKAKRLLRISEAFDLNDVFSKLSAAQKSSTENTVSYGIEDDDGNTMRVTVRADQAKDFERRMSEELSELVNLNQSGMGQFKETKKSVSMAELLFQLKDEFEILDVAFPTIPTDGIYNADKVSYNEPDTAETSLDMISGEESDSDSEEDISDEDGLSDLDDMDDAGDSLDSESDSREDLDGIDDISTDLDSEMPKGKPTEGDMLSKILDMLKADADAKVAQANAEAEKAKALQAEYAAKAAGATVAQQEEMMRMEAEVEAQKKKEKEAQKLADLAKYRAQNSKMAESFAFMSSLLIESDEYDTVLSVNRQLANLRNMFAPSPNDSKEEVAKKKADMMDARRELMARLNRVRRKDRFEKQNSQQNKVGDQPNPQQQTPANTNLLGSQTTAQKVAAQRGAR